MCVNTEHSVRVLIIVMVMVSVGGNLLHSGDISSEIGNGTWVKGKLARELLLGISALE